ncbi:MAG: cysteine hydrolase [Deltaproteobacteria bacterium]|nr:cysteine hydrolase [Deltaproteobacteria bacterium]MBW2633078.1 cysteine hydrolase [Deltaproteobacteria bacterium]MBW2676541.1 cysteine hydrolase [Deltaproteobacteria bacterium]
MKTGLILVDIQNDYFHNGKIELAGMETACENAGKLLSLFRTKAWPTFHVQHVSNYEGATFFLPDTDGIELNPCIRPRPEEMVIQKNFPNSFRGTGLLDALKTVEVERVVICGAMSHMCIDATTRAAADFGYACVVIHDACATRNLEFEGKTIEAEAVHASFMAALGSAYAEVTSCRDFVSKLSV